MGINKRLKKSEIKCMCTTKNKLGTSNNKATLTKSGDPQLKI